MNNFFVDFHCHPSIKPYGKSFSTDNPGTNEGNRKRRNSIWFYDSPDLFERGLQLATGINKFTQADCTTLAYGNVRVVCASLYPIEKGFFNNELGDGMLSDLAGAFVTGVGQERVDYIQEIKDYFEDLVGEYDFYLQLNGVPVKTDGGTFHYLLVSGFEDIEAYTQANPNDNNVIFIILTIEGLHTLLNNFGGKPSEQAILSNLRQIKKWEHPPFFVTFAHHFYNHLCGHAKSLTGLVGNTTDQSLGLGDPFTPLGKKVLKELLSNNNGKRILVDIKHMSAVARKEYMAILNDEYAQENIPIIVSHGAANGLRSMDEPVTDIKETAHKLLAEDINFYDNEIVAIARSQGIFALQLDERRIASNATLKHIRHSVFMNKIRHYRSELMWNQIQHIVELLNSHDLFAWDCIAIGSDFDGVINPLNGFLTQETIPSLQEYVERHAYNYMQGRGKQVLKSFNQIDADEIVSRVFRMNGWEFIRKHFK
ncbi:MAG: membrane dipeptidase [Ferruginibacter sp.]